MTATISSHILNGVNGTHAGGIKVRLINLITGIIMFDKETDSNGRLVHALDLADFDPKSRYEIIFETGRYWQQLGESHPQITEEIVLRFAMPSPSACYHIPFIISPNSYTTWWSQPE